MNSVIAEGFGEDHLRGRICKMLAVGASLMVGGGNTPGRPRIVRLEPDSGSPGDIIIAHGECLDRSRVKDLFLTGKECRVLVTILAWSETLIWFRIPAILKAGWYNLVIDPTGWRPIPLEQSVTLIVK